MGMSGGNSTRKKMGVHPKPPDKRPTVCAGNEAGQVNPSGVDTPIIAAGISNKLNTPRVQSVRNKTHVLNRGGQVRVNGNVLNGGPKVVCRFR